MAFEDALSDLLKKAKDDAGSLVTEEATKKRPYRRWLLRFMGLLRRADVRTALVTGSAGVVLAAVGLADLPLGVVLLATGFLMWAAFFATSALTPASEHTERARAWKLCSAGLTGYVLLSVVYVLWPLSSGAPQVYYFALNDAGETEFLRPSGEPGGSGLSLGRGEAVLTPLYGGQSYAFECQAEAPDGSTWLRLPGEAYWAPLERLHRVPYGDNRSMPECGQL